MSNSRTLRFIPSILSLFTVLACGDDGAGGNGGTAGAGGNGGEAAQGAGAGSGVCIKQACQSNDECDCEDGRVNCLIEPGETYGRCVACGDGTTTECPPGEVCSSFGECVPEGAECPTDGMGEPTIACASSADCVACDPAHQVCDTATNKCVACTETNTSACQPTDICKDGECAPACAKDCTVDNDCSKCNGAKACNNHICSECSETYACPAGSYCDLTTGTCEKECGQEGTVGVCVNDSDCVGCEGGTQVCHKAINADPDDLGTCGPDATGCSDLGDGALTLPPPYNEITNTCSNDGDCAGVGIQYNVGEALRDLLGADEILGQEIGDAFVEYPMDACANVTIANTSCGVCVPCRVDDDCQDLDIDSLTNDLFPGVAGPVVNLILNQIFGVEDKTVYMYCESVAAGYGVCVPCPGVLNDCAQTGGDTGGGTCDHPPEQEGTPLSSDCDPCAATVCASDAFCCTTAWDSLCVEAAATQCSGSNCHDGCVVGEPMGVECGPCEGTICNLDPYCCNTTWDDVCTQEYATECGGCP
jgi:hypothetical protein